MRKAPAPAGVFLCNENLRFFIAKEGNCGNLKIRWIFRAIS